MKGAWVGAAAVALTVNAAMLVPVYRAHHGGAATIAAYVCSDHLIGGYSQGDRVRLGIPVSSPATGTIDGVGLSALGFSDQHIELVGDSSMSGGAPAARPAWVRLVQSADSGASWRPLAVGPRRDDVEGPGLVVRARITVFMQARDGQPRVEPMVRVEPSSLYLDDDQAARLRALRTGAPRCIAALQLGNGTDGSVWVQSVP